jgi:TolB-like protein
VVNNNKGITIHSGETPMIITVDSGNGFFSKGKYFLSCNKDGYDVGHSELSAHMNGWYWGNIVFGGAGLVGMLFVDPVTGAMWKMDDTVMVPLSPSGMAKVPGPVETGAKAPEVKSAAVNVSTYTQLQEKKLHLAKNDTIAVLPFTIHSSQKKYEHLSQGFSDDLTYYLMKSEDIKIIDRNTVDKALSEIKSSNSVILDSTTAQNIGKVIGAKFIILGNVEVIDSEANVSCHVIKVENCENVLFEKVTGGAGNILQLRDQLGQKVNQRLVTM